MVTTYNTKDMISFSAFIANWQKKGMLEIDDKGNPIITEGLIENWKISENLRKQAHYNKVVIIENESRGFALKLTDPEEIDVFETARENHTPYETEMDGKNKVQISPWWDNDGWYYKCFKQEERNEPFVYYDSHTMSKSV